jgi:N-acetylmuramoyl-L-alanine amidase
MIGKRHAGFRHAGLGLAALIAIALMGGGNPASGQDRAGTTAKPKIADCQRATFRVVVDVGHTPAVPGAISARGVPEYTFNLALAQAVKQSLLDAGFASTVLLMTDKAPPHGLIERALRANAMPADLFIAIHHDSVPDNLMETWEYQGQQFGYNDQYPGYALFVSNDNADRAGSLLFGKLLGQALQARGLHFTPHYTLALMGRHRHEFLDADAGVYRYDALIVLRLTRMPAVLLEAGSIVNRDEELQLQTPERRELTGAAVAAAVEDFCQARARPGGDSVAKRVAPSRPVSATH